ncbi:MAG: MFS transporter [Gammaproteobacteria bacterium]|nr:MFS transporter [Gammaproteobacteria bacterium]MCH9743525.1 MFS transporter [Gammaproteobacteria bacterium]
MILIVAIMPICGFGVDIYTPSLPIITHLLHASHSLGKLTISIYILGFGLGQVFAGPLSDRFGRKIVLMISLLLFALASSLAPFSRSIQFLLFVRLLQGLAVAGQVLNVRAIAADCYQAAQLRKVSIYITTAWTLSPIIGPFIGGYLQTYIGWQAGFYFLTMYSMILLLCVGLFLSESNHTRQSMNINALLRNYRVIALDWHYMKNVLGLALGFSMINTFNVFGPFMVQVQMHYTPLFYAHMTLIIGCACFIGSIVNRLVVHRLRQETVIFFCIVWMLLVSMISGLLAMWYGFHIVMLILSVAIIIFATGMVYPNYSVNCSSMFKSMAGTAAALRGVVTMLGAAILTGLMSLIVIHQMVLFFLIYVVLAFVMLMVFKNKNNLSKAIVSYK